MSLLHILDEIKDHIGKPTASLTISEGLLRLLHHLDAELSWLHKNGDLLMSVRDDLKAVADQLGQNVDSVVAALMAKSDASDDSELEGVVAQLQDANAKLAAALGPKIESEPVVEAVAVDESAAVDAEPAV
jgi:hypothetical protein